MRKERMERRRKVKGRIEETKSKGNIDTEELKEDAKKSSRVAGCDKREWSDVKGKNTEEPKGKSKIETE